MNQDLAEIQKKFEFIMSLPKPVGVKDLEQFSQLKIDLKAVSKHPGYIRLLFLSLSHVNEHGLISVNH